MNFSETQLSGVYIIEPNFISDDRGWFAETWVMNDFLEHGLSYNFIQENHSYSRLKGTLRGLHFQIEPRAQTKLIRCTRGSILDVAVDIRFGSPTYRQWIAIELSANNMKQILIPKGFAHGFATLTDDVEVQYKTDEYYSAEHDSGFAWNDNTVSVFWGIDSPILSEKDRNAPVLSDSRANFIFKEQKV